MTTNIELKYKCPVCKHTNTSERAISNALNDHMIFYVCELCRTRIKEWPIGPDYELLNCYKRIHNYEIYYGKYSDSTSIHKLVNIEGYTASKYISHIAGFIGYLFECNTEQELENRLILL